MAKNVCLSTIFYILLAFVLVSCTEAPVVSEKVMLDIDCTWEEPPAMPDNPHGVLKITDSLDDYSEVRAFEEIISPDPAENSLSFNGNSIQLVRNNVGYFPSQMVSIPFVSGEDDHRYIWESLTSLSFSHEHSMRNELDGRVIIYFYEQENQTDEFYICPDGIVLKSVEEADGTIVYYESLMPVDYYRISALEVKYSQWTDKINWRFLDEQIPKNYKLCITGSAGNVDFTLEEAQEALSSLLNVSEIENIQITSKINHSVSHPSNSYIKITEYYAPFCEPGTIKEQTFYLSPDGKLIAKLQTSFAHYYHSQDWEYFECNYILVSEGQFDYDAFLNLLND